MTSNNNIGGLSTRAMLVDLSISCWIARKQDKKATHDAVKANNAKENSGKFHKRLIDVDNAATFVAAREAASSLRAFHYANTLPWSNAARVLPAKNYLEYMNGLREKRAKFEAAVELFIEDAPRLREQAKVMLGEMWNEEEFPTSDDLRSKFGIELDVYPLPDAGDFRVSLGDVEVEAMRQQITDGVQRATERAMRECWEKMYEQVTKMAERLSNPDGIFRDSLVDNLKELCEVLPRLNLTNDPELESMRADVCRKLASNDPESLRTDKAYRADVARQADEIARRMAAIMGGAK